VADTGVLETLRRVRGRHVVQQVSDRVLDTGAGHVHTQLPVERGHHVPPGKVVRDLLVRHPPDRQPRHGVHGSTLPDVGRVPGPPGRGQVPGHHRGGRAVLAGVGRGAQKLRDVSAGRGQRVPVGHRAGQPEPAVLAVLPREPGRHVAAGVLPVHIRAEPEHVLYGDAVRHTMFPGVGQVPDDQRRPAETVPE